MTVDILVVNYNTKDMLIRLLETLNSDWEPDVWKLYIADNGSTDGSKEWLWDLHRFGDLGLRVEHIFYNENIGYSAAINQMAEVSDSEILCAVNADTWFTTNHVKQAIQSFNNRPAAGVIGVKQLDEEHRIRHGGIFWDGVNRPQHRGWGQIDENDIGLHDAIQCWTVSGSIYYVRREAWNQVANYPPYRNLFPQYTGAFLPTKHYFEETFCSQMMHHLGWEVWYDGTIETAGHSWNASLRAGTEATFSPVAVDYFSESQKIYKDTLDTLGIAHEIH